MKTVKFIFDKCTFCPFCKCEPKKRIYGYENISMCIKSKYREIDKSYKTKTVKAIPEWCPLEEDTIVDFIDIELHNKNN